VTIGREHDCEVCLEHDDEVSRVHAVLERIGHEWVLIDDGLSRNGTFVNGERLGGRRRLRDGDAVRVGSTNVLYRSPHGRHDRATLQAAEALDSAALSATQRRILVALCRPFGDGAPFATAPSNKQIADEVSLSVARVKAHLRDLFGIFDIAALPHNEKRVRLVERALQTGIVSRHDLLE
jgi:pSer/pThr/pTyr-binding forkhead associated (FHA) protein